MRTELERTRLIRRWLHGLLACVALLLWLNPAQAQELDFRSIAPGLGSLGRQLQISTYRGGEKRANCQQP